MTDALGLMVARPIAAQAQPLFDWLSGGAALGLSDPGASRDAFQRLYETDYFADASLPPFFVMEAGRPVAFLRYVRCAADVAFGEAAAAEVIVDPALGDRDIAAVALRLGAAHLKGASDLDSLIATVPPDDSATTALLERAGFAAEPAADGRGRIFVQRLRAARWAAPRAFIIAEAGSNWRMGTPKRDLQMARALIDAAVEAGADAVKFQTYRPETVYAANAGHSNYLRENGVDEDINEIFADLAMPYEFIATLSVYCAEQGVEFMSTPFSMQDFDAVDPHVATHKNASYEISHVRLIERMARSGKPTIVSTGAASPSDITFAVETFMAAGGRNLCLLQCTAKYPAPTAALQLRTMAWMRRRYSVATGLSDHSREPLAGPMAAAALGARVIEKHYTLDNRLPGPDHAFAVTPGELRDMVRAIRDVEAALGNGEKALQPVEAELHAFAQRRLQATTDIKRGDALIEDQNVAILRPGNQRPGAHPRHIVAMHGRTAQRDIPLGDGVVEGDWA